jgi:hypothetical protein
VAAVQYTFTHKQYTEYRERKIHNNKKIRNIHNNKKIRNIHNNKKIRNIHNNKKIKMNTGYTTEKTEATSPVNGFPFNLLGIIW